MHRAAIAIRSAITILTRCIGFSVCSVVIRIFIDSRLILCRSCVLLRSQVCLSNDAGLNPVSSLSVGGSCAVFPHVSCGFLSGNSQWNISVTFPLILSI